MSLFPILHPSCVLDGCSAGCLSVLAHSFLVPCMLNGGVRTIHSPPSLFPYPNLTTYNPHNNKQLRARARAQDAPGGQHRQPRPPPGGPLLPQRPTDAPGLVRAGVRDGRGVGPLLEPPHARHHDPPPPPLPATGRRHGQQPQQLPAPPPRPRRPRQRPRAHGAGDPGFGRLPRLRCVACSDKTPPLDCVKTCADVSPRGLL